jgi:hypothetical protein
MLAALMLAPAPAKAADDLTGQASVIGGEDWDTVHRASRNECVKLIRGLCVVANSRRV